MKKRFREDGNLKEMITDYARLSDKVVIYVINLTGESIRSYFGSTKPIYIDRVPTEIIEITSTFEPIEVNSCDLLLNAVEGDSDRPERSGGFVALNNWIHLQKGKIISAGIYPFPK